MLLQAQLVEDWKTALKNRDKKKDALSMIITELKNRSIKDNVGSGLGRTVSDEVAIENRDSKLGVGDDLAHILAGVITVGGGQPDSIAELVGWFNALHPQDQQALTDVYETISPHLATNMKHMCNFCQKEFVHMLDLTSKQFFRGDGPAGSQGPAPKNV